MAQVKPYLIFLSLAAAAFLVFSVGAFLVEKHITSLPWQAQNVSETGKQSGSDLETDPDKNHRLCVAAMMGDLKNAEILLIGGVNANTTDAFGVSALERAVLWGHGNMVKLLVKHGADVNRKGRMGLTSLMLAASQGDIWIIKLLIHYGADVNAESEDGETPFSIAMKKGNFEAVEFFKASGSREIMRDSDTDPAVPEEIVEISEPVIPVSTPVRTVVKPLGKPETAPAAKAVRLEPAAINISPPLPHSIETKHERQRVKSLPMEIVIEEISLPKAKSVIEDIPDWQIISQEVRGASRVQKSSVKTEAPISTLKIIENLERELDAYFEEVRDIEKSLLESVALQARPAERKDRQTEPESAERTEQKTVQPAEEVLRQRELFSDLDRAGFFQASLEGDLESLTSLIERGVDVNMRTALEMTPLMLAAQDGHVDVVQYLLTHGARVNARNIVGHSALKLASLREQHQIMDVLKRYGANE